MSFQLDLDFRQRGGFPYIAETAVGNIIAPDTTTTAISGTSDTYVVDQKGIYQFYFLGQTTNILYRCSVYLDGTQDYPTGSIPLAIYFWAYEEGEPTPDCSLIDGESVVAIPIPCTTQMSFINGIVQPDTETCWTFGDGTTSCGQSVTKTFYGSGAKDVILTMSHCYPTGEYIPGCCGQSVPEIICYECSEIVSTVVEPYVPNLQPIFTCNHSEPNQKSLHDCISGCGGCTCEEVHTCKCLPINSTVTISFTGLIETIHCLETGTIEIKVNDEIQDTQTINTIEDYEPVELTFSTEGKYTIEVTGTNCCKECSFTHTITIGSGIYLDRVSCKTLTLKNTHNFDASERVRIDVKNLKQETLSTYLFESYLGEDITIVLPSDGIFIVSYNVIDAIGVVLSTKQFAVYEFCSLLECYNKMIKDLLCQDCTDCLDQKNKINILHTKLAEFNVLATAFYAALNVQYGVTFGNMFYKEEYLGWLLNTETLYENLTKVCSDCSTLTSGCTSCN